MVLRSRWRDADVDRVQTDWEVEDDIEYTLTGGWRTRVQINGGGGEEHDGGFLDALSLQIGRPVGASWSFVSGWRGM